MLRLDDDVVEMPAGVLRTVVAEVDRAEAIHGGYGLSEVVHGGLCDNVAGRDVTTQKGREDVADAVVSARADGETAREVDSVGVRSGCV
jgi:hypothetical protein